VDDNGNILGPGQKGTVEISSPSLMIGYLGFPRCDEWFRTSDYGWVDTLGRLYIQGRLDDIVIRNGVKVPLVMIEQTLMKSGMITGAMAFVTSKESTGALRVEVAVTSDMVDEDLCEKLLKWCRVSIDDCLWPQRIHVLTHFVFKKNGKLDKVAIKKLALEQQ